MDTAFRRKQQKGSPLKRRGLSVRELKRIVKCGSYRTFRTRRLVVLFKQNWVAVVLQVHIRLVVRLVNSSVLYSATSAMHSVQHIATNMHID